MEVIGLGLGNTISCPDELINDQRQCYRTFGQSLHCPIIHGCFLSGKSQPIVTLQFWGIRLSHKCQVPTEYEKIKDSVLPRKMQEEHLSVPPLFQH